MTQSRPTPRKKQAVGTETTWQVVDDGLNWLRDRGILDTTIAAFGIVASGKGCTFPAPHNPNYQVWKNADSGGHPKYRMPAGPAPRGLYADPELQAAVRRADGQLWIVGSFPDVWTMHSAGIHNAACFYGELSTITPEALAAVLDTIGAHIVHYPADRDETGRRAAVKLAQALAGSGVLYLPRILPGPEGGKQDINALWQDLAFDAAAFAAALQALPVMPLPETKPRHTTTPAPVLGDVVKPRGLARVLEDPDYWLDRAAAEFADRNRGGFWLACQLRDAGHDAHTAAAVLIHYAGLVGSRGDHPYTEREALASVTSAYSRPARDAVVLSETAPGSEYVQLPTNAREALAQAGLIGLARFLDGLYLAGKPAGWRFTIEQAAAAHPGMSRRAIERLLKTLPANAGNTPHSAPNGATVRAANAAPLIPASNTDGDQLTSKFAVYPSFCVLLDTAKSDDNSRRGRKTVLYRLPGPLEVCDLLGVEPGAPDVLPAWALASNGKYRAAMHHDLIARRPGQYDRAWLGERAGVGRQAPRYWERVYPELADLQIERTYIPAAVASIADLPEHKGAVRIHRRQDEGYRPILMRIRGQEDIYTATRRAVEWLAAQGHAWGDLEFFTYGANFYSIAAAPEDAPQAATAPETAAHDPIPAQAEIDAPAGFQEAQAGQIRACAHCGQVIMPGITPAGECPFCGATRPPKTVDPLVQEGRALGGEARSGRGVP